MANFKGLAIAAALAAGIASGAAAQSVTADFSAAKTPVSPNLYGIFFEDINYAADGGIYGEMVQNRSFEFRVSGKGPTDSWTDRINISGEKGKSRLRAINKGGLNKNNPTFVQFKAEAPGEGFSNKGYKGMFFEAGKTYPGSVYLRSTDGSVTSMTVTIGEDKKGAATATAKINGIGTEWKKYEFSLKAAATTTNGKLALYADQAGTVDVDFVSLFMADIYRNEPNGLRKDLAEMLEAMHPRFIRFPGGCIVHGMNLADRYQWKHTVGPVEERKENRNFWNYQQSYGLGFYEYFRLCEDLGAEPIPVLSVGMAHSGERDDMRNMPNYVQDALDLVEYATGPADSTWGKIRAEAGHPAPFKLNYIGIGNEDCGDDYFPRYKQIADALKAKYPDIKLIISSGFTYNDTNFHSAWNHVRSWEKDKKIKTPIVDLVDEHYYNPALWFLTNGNRYDNLDFYPRDKNAKVFIGEYAAWDDGRHNSLYAALTEAAYMTSIERNGDIIEIASYAPLFARDGFVQWFPDAIWFNSSQVYGTPNYHVQSMFSNNKSDRTIKTTVTQPAGGAAKKASIGGTVGLGSWATTAQFKDIKLTNADTGAVIFASDKNTKMSAFNAATEKGKWSVSGGVINQASMDSPAFYALDNEDDMEGVDNYTLELSAQKTGGAEGFLISFGVKGAKSLYWWNMGGWGNTQSCVEKGSLTGRSIIGDSQAMSLSNGRWYKIKIEVRGESYKCYLDGALIHEFTDSMNFDPLYAHVGETDGGKVIVKLVNVSKDALPVTLNLNGANLASTGKATILTGALDDENSFRRPDQVAPKTESVSGVSSNFTYTVKPYSLTVLELQKK